MTKTKRLTEENSQMVQILESSYKNVTVTVTNMLRKTVKIMEI